MSSHVFMLSNWSAPVPQTQTQTVAVPSGSRFVTVRAWIHNSVEGPNASGLGYIRAFLLSGIDINTGFSFPDGTSRIEGIPTLNSNQYVQNFSFVSMTATRWVEVAQVAEIPYGTVTLGILLGRITLDDSPESGNVALFDNVSVTFQCAAPNPTSSSPTTSTTAPSSPAPSPAPTAAPTQNTSAPVPVGVGHTPPDLSALNTREVAMAFDLDFDTLVVEDVAHATHHALLEVGVRERDIERINVYPGSVIIIVTFKTQEAFSLTVDSVNRGQVFITLSLGTRVNAVRAASPTTMAPTGATRGSSSGSASKLSPMVMIVVGCLILVIATVSVTFVNFQDEKCAEDIKTMDGSNPTSGTDRSGHGSENPLYDGDTGGAHRDETPTNLPPITPPRFLLLPHNEPRLNTLGKTAARPNPDTPIYEICIPVSTSHIYSEADPHPDQSTSTSDLVGCENLVPQRSVIDNQIDTDELTFDDTMFLT